MKVSGVSVQRRRWPRASSQIEKETNERRTSNIERPTLSNEFCQFKKIEQSEARLFKKRIKRSVIIIGRSMLGVRCSTFNLLTVPTMCFIRGVRI
jgi:hypothetical protein